jgi:hypothetical protein
MVDWTKVLEKMEDKPAVHHIAENPGNSRLHELFWAERSAERRPPRGDPAEPHLRGATLCIFWGFVLGLSALALVWIYHMVMPEQYCFLSEVQKSKLDAVLLTVITTLFVADRARRVFKS